MKAKYVYVLTILHMGNEFSYSQCMLDFDDVLQDCFEEGYFLANRMYIFFSNESFSDIEKKLESMKANYSHCLTDATESILNGNFKLDIDRIFANQKEISQSLLNTINEFKKQNAKVLQTLDKQAEIDQILDKISKYGKGSLTPEELNILNNY